jgi:hypothetical protein
MKILIALHGSHSQPDAMQAQRETWLRELRCDYRYFLGRPSRVDRDVEYLESEDGPIWNGPFRTWYLNRKTEGLIRYGLDHGYDYVFKCDDDTYIWPDRLLSSGFEKYDYSGVTEPHTSWRIGHYRWAQGGAGYWLSRRAMEYAATYGLNTIPAEDFAVGYALAANGISPHHDERYVSAATTEQLSNPSPDLITLHKVSPSWMRRLHGCR